MNSKTSKTLRKFADIQKLNYTEVKNLFQKRSTQQQRVDLHMMKIVILKGGENKMANQLICDRKHNPARVIGENEEYLPIKVKQPEGEWLDIALCAPDAMEFNAFLQSTPAPRPGDAVAPEQPAASIAPAAPAQPEQPAAPAQPANAVVDPNNPGQNSEGQPTS